MTTCVWPVVALLSVVSLNAQSPDASFTNSVQPVLAKHCFSCHNQKLAMAKLDLASFGDSNTAAGQPHVWEKVREKVSARQMPPAGQPPLHPADLTAVIRWIDEIVKPSP